MKRNMTDLLFREEDYLTEVHHINGDGQDAGVVYSEMQVGQTKIMSTNG